MSSTTSSTTISSSFSSSSVEGLIAGFAAGLTGGLSGADTLGGALEVGRTCFLGRCTSSELPPGDAFFGFCGFSVLEGAVVGRAVFDTGTTFDCSALSAVGLFFCRFDWSRARLRIGFSVTRLSEPEFDFAATGLVGGAVSSG